MSLQHLQRVRRRAVALAGFAVVICLWRTSYAMTFLAAGGAPGTGSFVLRSTNGDWLPVTLPTLDVPALSGVVYSATTTTWAYGGSEAGSVLLQSGDDGVTWRDISATLPDELRRQWIIGMGFADERRGTLVAMNSGHIGPYIWETSDGGANWILQPPRNFATGKSCFVGRRLGSESIVRVPGPNTLAERSSGSDRIAVTLPLFSGKAIVETGGSRWITGTKAASPEAPSAIPAVHATNARGTWIEQAIPADIGQLTTIDFIDADVGIACGSTFPIRPIEPRCFFTNDGGASWQQSGIVGDLTESVVEAAVLGSATSGRAAIRSINGGGFALLATEDGGRTWQHAPTPSDSIGSVFSIAVTP